jgi:hypothetical protein
MSKIEMLQAELEAWLAPMLTGNGGPARTIESMFFVSPNDAERLMEQFKERAPGVFLSYPSESFQSPATKSTPNIGGRCSEMTTLTYSLFIVYTGKDNQASRAAFIYAARDRLFNSISSREFSQVVIEDAQGNKAKATILDLVNASAVDSPDMIVWTCQFRIQMAERAVGY